MLDHIRRRNHIKFELKNRLIRSILKTPSLTFAQRHLAIYAKSSIPRSSSITRISNRCVYTGRKFSVLRKFQMSRFALRDKAYDGYLPGLRRHS